MTRNLSHVAEEVVTSLTPSSEPIRELHSITDLSSDEKEDKFDVEITKVLYLFHSIFQKNGILEMINTSFESPLVMGLIEFQINLDI